MTVSTVPPAIVALDWSGAGIVAATDPPPAAIETAQLPCLFVFTGEADYDWADVDQGWESRMYRVQVAVIPTTLATPETRETRCRPVLLAVRGVLASSPQLGQVRYVQSATVLGDSGIAILPEYDGKYVGFEVRLQVREVFSHTFSEGE